MGRTFGRPPFVEGVSASRGPGGAATSGQTYPELAERLAADTGWVVLAFNFRGTGASEGNFSLAGWLDGEVAEPLRP